MAQKNQRATMLAVGVHVAAFSCEFEGDTAASGKITTSDDQSRGPVMGWTATLHNSKWTIAPTGGRRTFSLDSRLNQKIQSYIGIKLRHGTDVEFDEDEAPASIEETDLVAA